VMLSKSKALLNFGKVISVPEIQAKVTDVTAEKVHAAAVDLLGNSKRSALVYMPKA